MKKCRFTFIITIIMLVLLTGCGNDNNSTSKKVKETSSESVVNIGEKFIIENYAEITVKGVEVSDKVEPPKNDGFSLIYENDDSNNTYVTAILEVKNLSSEDVGIDKIANVSINKDKSKYVSNLFLLLTDDDTTLSEYKVLSPLSSGIVYCSTQVSKDSLGESTITFMVNDKKYNLNYDTLAMPIEKKSINFGDKLVGEDYAEFTLKAVEYTKDVLPSNPGDFYTHYEVEDTNNIYIDVITEIKNLRSSDYEAKKFFNAKVLYDGKYTYNGFIVAEEPDGSSLDSYISIAPLATTKVHSLIEVPKEVINGEMELCIYFNGEKHYIKLDKNKGK